MIRITFIFLMFTLAFTVVAQDDKTVTLTVTGEGKTKEEAQMNALRSAIEQAFGTFISSNTQVLNDELIKDEIVSVTNGNIQKYEVLSEIQLPNNLYANTSKATVSIIKLTSFCENKGITVEFKGALFAMNEKMEMLNKQNEIKVIKNTCWIIKQIADKSFDYSIKVSAPLEDGNRWRIPIEIKVSVNDAFFQIPELLNITLSGLALKETGGSVEERKSILDEIKNNPADYLSKNKSGPPLMINGKTVYPITVGISNTKDGYYLLRSQESIMEIIETLYYFNHAIQNFKISNGIDSMTLSTIKEKRPNNLWIIDQKFRVFMRKYNDGRDYTAYCKASVFYSACDCGYWKQSPGDSYSNSQANCLTPVLSYEKMANKVKYEDVFLTLQNKIVMNGPFDPIVYFDNNYSFVRKISKKNKGGFLPGTVISFIDINKADKALIQFICNDFRTLDEIDKISEYKIIPNN